MSSQALLFVIVGKNEPLYEYNKVQAADSVTRQNYFVLHSALDLVEKAAWTTNNMYLRVVDKVCLFRCGSGGRILKLGMLPTSSRQVHRCSVS